MSKPTREMHDMATHTHASITPLILTDAAFHRDVEDFNAHDQELYPGTIDNDHAWEFLQRNVPLFDCPDPRMRQIYDFRWWTYRKHLRNSPAGWIVTEFLPGLLKSCTDRPSGKVYLLLTDAAPKRWLDLDELGTDDPVHAQADATVRGTASDVLLWLTNRRADSVDVHGDRDLFEAWTRLKR